jgi:CheY-like chemotaxis protein
MESIKNDSIEPELPNNFRRLYTRFLATSKDYKLMKTATFKGLQCTDTANQYNNIMQCPSKNMSELITDDSAKIRILVVEDDNMIRKSISKTIRDYGKDKGYKVDVEECEDGFECLYKIYIGFSKNHKYKCIITDDQMKFLNGTFMAYLIQLLIEDRILYPMHIYLVSSNTFPESLFRGIKLFNNIFEKPLTKIQIGQIFRGFEKEGIQEDVNDGEEEDEMEEDALKEEKYGVNLGTDEEEKKGNSF